MVCHKTLENQLIPPNNEKCRDANIVTNNKTADIPTAPHTVSASPSPFHLSAQQLSVAERARSAEEAGNSRC